MENRRKALTEKTRTETRVDKMKVRRLKKEDEKENENRSGDGSRGKESTRVGGVQRMEENGMNER